jgi:hypothetical protein
MAETVRHRSTAHGVAWTDGKREETYVATNADAETADGADD